MENFTAASGKHICKSPNPCNPRGFSVSANRPDSGQVQSTHEVPEEIKKIFLLDKRKKQKVRKRVMGVDFRTDPKQLSVSKILIEPRHY